MPEKNAARIADSFSDAEAGCFAFKHLETRGIERVPETERYKRVTASDYAQMALLWFSTNITANNVAVGMLGPIDYSLGFTDAALCSVFGAILGAVGVGYMSTFGPVSGNRTMVCALPAEPRKPPLREECRSLLGTSWATGPARSALFSTLSSCWAMG